MREATQGKQSLAQEQVQGEREQRERGGPDVDALGSVRLSSGYLLERGWRWRLEGLLSREPLQETQESSRWGWRGGSKDTSTSAATGQEI